MARTLRCGTAVVAILAVATVGLCLLDRHESGVESCVPLVTALTLPLALPLPLTGRLRPALVPGVPVPALERRTPPPRA